MGAGGGVFRDAARARLMAPPAPAVPPELSVPRGRSHLLAQEGQTVELQCLVSGKPKPIILWSRAEESGAAAAAAAAAPPAMPDGSAEVESYDGTLRISNVTRELSGTYRCRTSQYNGFNVKPREALIHLVVQCEDHKHTHTHTHRHAHNAKPTQTAGC